MEALNSGAAEESLAMDPRTSLNEGVPSTVSMERHYRCARGHYSTAFGLLDEAPTLRQRVRDKIQSLDMSIDMLADLNGRYLPPHPQPACR